MTYDAGITVHNTEIYDIIMGVGGLVGGKDDEWVLFFHHINILYMHDPCAFQCNAHTFNMVKTMH